MSDFRQLSDLMSKSIQGDLRDYARVKSALQVLVLREGDPGLTLPDDPMALVALLDERFQDLRDTIKDARERGY